jgi:hypothetical protein
MTRVRFSTILVSAWLAAAGATSWSSLLASKPVVAPRQPKPAGYWFKGNTHTHSLRSDGDSTPDQVAQWYRDHDYDFLVLSDHNRLSPAETLNASYGADHQFLVIQGEEVTDDFQGQPIHVNALGVSENVEPQHGASVLDTLQRDVDAIRRAGGVPLIDHPNYVSPIGADTLRQVERSGLVEVFNQHPGTNSRGSAGVPGMEEVWDRILTGGRVTYGIADDDAHTFKASSDPMAARPGRGWVFVHAERLAAQSILDALQRGDFYASTGVELTDYQVTGTGITVDIRDQPSRTYRVQFIGQNGRVLREVTSTCASYTFTNNDMYVRVRIEDSTGAFAWTQPVFRTDRQFN